MNLDDIYSDKHVNGKTKGSLLKFVNILQLLGSIFELYTVNAVSTGKKLLTTIEKNSSKQITNEQDN